MSVLVQYAFRINVRSASDLDKNLDWPGNTGTVEIDFIRLREPTVYGRGQDTTGLHMGGSWMEPRNKWWGPRAGLGESIQVTLV